MSYEDELQDFLTKEEPKPEDIFSMVTIMPRKKIKVTAYLEDKEGNRVLISEMAESLVSYITEQMKTDETTPVNSQLFPLCGQFMTSIVPRFVGLQTAMLMLEATAFREALLMLSLSSILLMQYIEQHELKIITEVVTLSDEEIASFLSRSNEIDERIRRAFSTLFSNEADDSDA